MDTTELLDAHRALLAAATVAAAAGGPGPVPVATYDNRISHDAWTLDRVISLAGGSAGLRERIRGQGDALAALCGPALSDVERDTLVPALLISHGKVLVDQPVALRDLIIGLVESELPGHTKQLLALLP